MARFEPDVFAEAPSLVIWQVGTNAVFRNKEFDFEKVVAAIATGLDRLRSHSKDMDVMLIDPQYVPAMLLDDKAELSERMVAQISAAAERVKANVFHRWALMRHWHVHNNIALDRMIDPTELGQAASERRQHASTFEGLSDTIRKAVAAAGKAHVRLRNTAESIKFARNP